MKIPSVTFLYCRTTITEAMISERFCFEQQQKTFSFTMLASLLIVSFVSFLPQAAVACNSIHLFNGDDKVMIVPEYVCIAKYLNHGEIKESRNIVCDGQGGGLTNIYDNLDCLGPPIRTEDPCFNPQTFTYRNTYTDCSYTMHCGGELCTYAFSEEWWGNVTDCDGDVPAANTFTNYTSYAAVLDHCVVGDASSNKWVCTDRGVMGLYFDVEWHFYMTNDCSGDTFYESSLWGDCPCPACSTFASTASRVDCDAVAPSGYATSVPTTDPTINPTVNPTIDPTANPTRNPTHDPTVNPSGNPTENPTRNPTINPSIDPTANPTTNPTIDPTVNPSPHPTIDPTASPTRNPTIDPTVNPGDPTTSPTRNPTIDPTANPTLNPTINPTISPTRNPIIGPTVNPTRNPISQPSTNPSSKPSTSSPSQSSSDDDTNPGSCAYGVKVSRFIAFVVVSVYLITN
eukprot:419674_1